ncbi:hypothetical protein [Streptomyces sp. NBC_00212]|uniref:hypothetical protein n=1 Tax=Streptomyces sp. NBC_00212 TaxID=2975684 RepID=UPI002F9130D7
MFRHRAGIRLVVLRDTDAARAAIQRALDNAEPGEAAGLGRALELLGTASQTDSELIRDWTLQILRDAGVDPKAEMNAVRALRAAEPALDLQTAVDLVKNVARR